MLTKIRQIFPFNRVVALFTLVLLIVVSVGNSASGQAVTQGYGADGNLQSGMLVRIKESDATKIETASIEASDKLHGVVVNFNDAPVTISSDDQKVFVATTGKYDVLVSDQNGSIKPGDYIAVSSLNGIGMRSDDSQPVVAGKALEGFDGETGVISTSKLDDHTVNIGRIKTDILVARNPKLKAIADLPDFLTRTAEGVAGKPVPTGRIYMSLTIFMISTAIATSLLYSAVRSGIISVGRNPLSKKSIVRGMMQVIIVGLTIFISGIFAVYLLLRL